MLSSASRTYRSPLYTGTMQLISGDFTGSHVREKKMLYLRFFMPEPTMPSFLKIGWAACAWRQSRRLSQGNGKDEPPQTNFFGKLDIPAALARFGTYSQPVIYPSPTPALR